MVRLKILTISLLGLAAVSCAAPKAPVVAEKPVEKKQQEKVPEPAVVNEPEMPALPSDDAPRLPGMLELPADTAFRPSATVLPKTNSGGVIIRPPTDPPSRVKPKDPAPE